MSGEGPEFEGLWALGVNLDIRNLETVTEANYLCNRYGLDLISTGGTIACAMELSQKGYGELGLKFGDEGAPLELVRKIAYREGVGDELAEGSLRLAKKYGAAELSMSVKGLELPAYDPRGAQGMGLGYATSNRGGCHLRGGYLIAQEVLGVPKMVDRFSADGKAGLLIVAQDMAAVVDSLVMCQFTHFALSGDYYARLLSAVTGIHFAPQELAEIGERIWNLDRQFNLAAGFTSADDTLPPRLISDPVPSGPAQGHTTHLAQMLSEYYRFRGWDEEGRPGENKLASLTIKR
jgi:aldehyde:ferredoxin oxidoreductase